MKAGRTIFVRIKLSLWSSFMKMSSRLIAPRQNAFWNFWDCHFRRVWKSNRQPSKNKLLEYPKNGQNVISSSKGPRQARLLVSSGACEFKQVELPRRHRVTAKTSVVRFVP